MNKKDIFIKEKLQQDKQISNKANKLFENIKEEFKIENNERKVIKIGFNKFLAIAASVVIVGFLGIGLYINTLGKSNNKSNIQAIAEKDIELENYVNSEIGISFNYPKEWEYLDNNHGSGVVIVGLAEPSNEKHNENICFSVTYNSNDEKLSPKQYIEKIEEYKKTEKEGSIDISGNEGYYFETSEIKQDTDKEYKNKETTIYVEVNSLMYTICYYGDEELYNAYYNTFEKMLRTIKFSKPTYIEVGNQESSNNEDIQLTNYINSEIGVCFYYPGEWTQIDNNHGSGTVGVWLNRDSNERHIENVYFWISEESDDKNLSLEKYSKKYGDFTDSIGQGSTKVNGNESYYIKNRGYRTESETNYEYETTTIYVKANSIIYKISFSGDKKLYDKYYNAFEKMLGTIKFSKPTYIEVGNQESSNNEDIQLTNYINSEIGVCFYYPGEWTQIDNNHGSGTVGVWLNRDSNERHIENVYFWISEESDDKKLTPEKYSKKYGDFTDSIGQGSTKVNGNESYYIKNRGYRTESETNYEYETTTIYVKANSIIYKISFSGDKKLYDKYYNAFEKILATIKFSKPSY